MVIKLLISAWLLDQCRGVRFQSRVDSTFLRPIFFPIRQYSRRAQKYVIWMLSVTAIVHACSFRLCFSLPRCLQLSSHWLSPLCLTPHSPSLCVRATLTPWNGSLLSLLCPFRVSDPQAAKVLEDEVKIAEDKFQESKVLAETAMANFLSSDVSSLFCVPVPTLQPIIVCIYAWKCHF